MNFLSLSTAGNNVFDFEMNRIFAASLSFTAENAPGS
jgi:hypothetical protein